MNNNCLSCPQLFYVNHNSQVIFCNNKKGDLIDNYTNKKALLKDFNCLQENKPKFCSLKHKNSRKKPQFVKVSTISQQSSIHQVNPLLYQKTFSYLYLTYSCNNNCLFCYVKKQKDDNLFFQDNLKKWINERNPQNPLVIVGGEPTLNPNLLKILTNLTKKKFTYCLITNGRYFANNLFTKKVILTGIKNITVSLHSHLEKDHNLLTRTNSYKETIKGIKNLIKNQNQLDSLRLSIVINKVNYTYLEDITKFIIKLEIKEIRYNSLFVNEVNKFKKSEIYIDPYKTVPHLEKALKYIEQTPNVKAIVTSYPLCYFKKKYQPFLRNERLHLQQSNYAKNKLCSFLTTISHKCIDCKMKKKCPGLYYNSLLHFGDDHFKPIKNSYSL
jgi:MoaA/NifB/PqqE/SkfB family radical SAM enzyme